MRVAFFSCFPDDLFREGIEKGTNYSQTTQAGQKFEKLFVKGLCGNGFDVDDLFFYRTLNDNKLLITENFNNRIVRNYGYKLHGTLIKRTILRYHLICGFINQFAKNNPDAFILVDALNPYSNLISRLAKRNHIKVVSFVTDIIDFILIENGTIIRKLRNKLVKHLFYNQFRYSSLFVFLAEPMKEKIHKKKPFIIIDGMCDAYNKEDEEKSIVSSNKAQMITFLYTGTICKKFGVCNLIDGFLKARIPNSEMVFYGDGDFVEDLANICKREPSVKYCGVVPNEMISRVQKSSSFLVNPRPINDEYTKYSFPSKTIEYMATGVPVITTKLPSISSEYDLFLNYFKDDDADGIADTLLSINKVPYIELKRKGMMAREYVLNYKNVVYQCKKIIDKVNEVDSWK